jgi:hypothetical protein
MLASDARRPFDAASIDRAIKAEVRRQAAQRAGRAAGTSEKYRSTWECVLVGAGVGGVSGGLMATTDGGCNRTKPVGWCGSQAVNGANAKSVGVGTGVGAVLGGGLGLVVGLLMNR